MNRPASLHAVPPLKSRRTGKSGGVTGGSKPPGTNRKLLKQAERLVTAVTTGT